MKHGDGDRNSNFLIDSCTIFLSLPTPFLHLDNPHFGGKNWLLNLVEL